MPDAGDVHGGLLALTELAAAFRDSPHRELLEPERRKVRITPPDLGIFSLMCPCLPMPIGLRCPVHGAARHHSIDPAGPDRGRSVSTNRFRNLSCRDAACANYGAALAARCRLGPQEQNCGGAAGRCRRSRGCEPARRLLRCPAKASQRL